MISRHLSVADCSSSLSMAYAQLERCIELVDETHLFKFIFSDKFLGSNHLRSDSLILGFNGQYFLEVWYSGLGSQSL
jgi:hypothetical protein